MTPRHKCRLMRLLFEQMFSTKPGKKLTRVKFEYGGGVIDFAPSPTLLSVRTYEGVLQGRNLLLMEVNRAGFSNDSLLRKWGFECAWLWENFEDFNRRRRLCFLVKDDEGRIGVYSESRGDPLYRAYIELKSKISENRAIVMRLPDKS